MIVAGVPLARIGSEDDIAGACVFLSSKAGSWVNGCVWIAVMSGCTPVRRR